MQIRMTLKETVEAVLLADEVIELVTGFEDIASHVLRAEALYVK